jgi:hypothetical protein
MRPIKTTTGVFNNTGVNFNLGNSEKPEESLIPEESSRKYSLGMTDEVSSETINPQSTVDEFQLEVVPEEVVPKEEEVRPAVVPKVVQKALWSLATSCCTVLLIGGVYGVIEALKGSGQSANLPLVNATMDNLSQSPASAESPLNSMFADVIRTGADAMLAKYQG